MVDLNEASRLLGLSKRQVQRLVSAGELPLVVIGASRRIRRDDLVSFVDGLVGPKLLDQITGDEDAPSA